jgi:hypothetical protein
MSRDPHATPPVGTRWHDAEHPAPTGCGRDGVLLGGVVVRRPATSVGHWPSTVTVLTVIFPSMTVASQVYG